MRFVLSLVTLVLSISLVAAPLLGAGAAPLFFFKVEYHRYAIGQTGLLGVEGDCDAESLGAVVFCETLQSDEAPNKFHVAIQDDLPIPVSGHWEFRTHDGVVLWEGSFCKEHNGGPIPENATHFVVRVDVHAGCAPIASQGWVIVTWRWTPEAELAPPPEEPCECPCTCP